METKFLIEFNDKPDCDACGGALKREKWNIAQGSKVLVPVVSWDEVPEAVEEYIDRHYGDLDYPEGPVECWVWEEGKVEEARELSAEIERTISVRAQFVSPSPSLPLSPSPSADERGAGE